MSEQTDIIRRVSALLRKSTDMGATEAEAEAAAVKAQDMMLSHGIAMVDVAKYDAEGNTVKLEAEHIKVTMDTGSNRRPTWDVWLAFNTARAMGGKAVHSPSMGIKSHGTFEPGFMDFFGLNVEAMVEVFQYLRMVGDVESAKAMRERPPERAYDPSTGEFVTKKVGGRRFRLGWLSGYVQRLRSRMEEHYRKIEQESETNGKALVLVRDLVDEKMREVYPNLGTLRSGMRMYHGGAYKQGTSFADNVDIGMNKLDRGTLGIAARSS